MNTVRKASKSLVHNLTCVCSILTLQHEIYVLQATNAAEAWQRGYELIHFLAQYSIFHSRADLNRAWVKRQCRSIQYPLAANIKAWVGACAEIVGPFNAPPSCNRPPSIFDASSCKCPWCLPGTMQEVPLIYLS